MIDTLAIFCGGLGHNQFRDAPTAATQCPPNVQVEFLDDEGYLLGTIPPICTMIFEQQQTAQKLRVVVIDHSMGWIAGAKAALEGLVDYLIVLDAVGVPGVSNENWPRVNGVRQPGLLYRAQWTPGITQLWIADGPAIIDVPVGHNELPHDPGVIASILAAIGGNP